MPRVLTSTRRFDVATLANDVSTARSISEFDQGPYGNCISLPSERDLPPQFRENHNNVPFADALSQCPGFREIFDCFHAEKAAFRLLRRTPKTAYALHDDRDKGRGIVRFQIPIITNDQAFLLLTDDQVDLTSFESLSEQIRQGSERNTDFDLKRLDELLAGKFELYSLQPGQIYYFDTDKLHTLVNAGDQERIVLSIDVVRNDWLRDWIQTEFTIEVAPSDVPRTMAINWEWASLRHGVIRNA